jgi:hypothetical protein
MGHRRYCPGLGLPSRKTVVSIASRYPPEACIRPPESNGRLLLVAASRWQRKYSSVRWGMCRDLTYWLSLGKSVGIEPVLG